MSGNVLVGVLLLGVRASMPETDTNFCAASFDGWGGSGGSEFDDCNDKGLRGGITQICGRGGSWLNLFGVRYGDAYSEHGGQGGDWSCFDLMQDEFINHVDICWGEEWFRPVIFSVQFKTTMGRSSQIWGSNSDSCASADAPEGQHLVFIAGSAGMDVDSLEFNWGTGGSGSGWWLQRECKGCTMPWTVKTELCTTTSESHTKEVSDSWTLAAKSDLSLGFTLEGVGDLSASREISGSYSHNVVVSSSSSFELKKCETLERPCSKNFFYQWQMQTMMGTRNPDTTTTDLFVCTDSEIACCLPGTFSGDPSDCDLDRSAPNTCPSHVGFIVA